METIVISGSMRFQYQMRLAAWLLETDALCAVIQCVYNDFGLEVTEQMHKDLDAAHFKKIDLADSLYVMDINGYIGDHTRAEIEYAKSKGKTIYYHSQDHKQICHTWRKMLENDKLTPDVMVITKAIQRYLDRQEEKSKERQCPVDHGWDCTSSDIWAYLLEG